MSLSTSAVNSTAVTLRDVKIASWVCFLSWTFAVYDFVLFGNLLPVMAADLGWSSSTSTLINTFVTAGTALVAMALGPFVDRVGRKKGIFVAVAGAALASLLTAFAGWLVGVIAGLGLVVLVLVRAFAGLGYGEQAINAAYLNEMYDHTFTEPRLARRRGFVYSLVQAGWPVGAVLAAESVRLLYPAGGWSLCFVVAAFPALFIIFASRWLKESPVYEHGRADQQPWTADLRSLFASGVRRSTLAISGAFLLNWFGVVVFSILGTSFLTDATGKGIDFSNALLVLVVSNGTSFVGYLFFGWLGDTIGRRNSIGLGWLASAVSFTALVAAPDHNFGVAVGLYSLGLFSLIGPFSAVLYFTGESFPVSVRATGSSLVNACGQLGAVAANLLITAVLDGGGSWDQAAMWCGCLPILLSGALVFAAPAMRRRTSSTPVAEFA